MANIFPKRPVGKLPSEVVSAYFFFDSFPETFWVWHKVARERKDEPDFLLLDEQHHALLVRVNTIQKITVATQRLLFPEGIQRMIDCTADEEILSNYVTQLKSQFEGFPDLTCVLLFPNFTAQELVDMGIENSSGSLLYLGKESLHKSHQSQWFAYLKESCTLEENELHLVRQYFCPDVKIPDDLTTRTRPAEWDKESFLLDYNQERITKLDLVVSDEHQSVVRNFDINIVNGVAGSGKTLILLYRLRLLQELNPRAQFLVLTYNRPLMFDIQQRYYKLVYGRLQNVTFRTFMQLCYALWPEQERFIKPMGEQSSEDERMKTWRKHFLNSPISYQMFEKELNWFKGRQIETQEEYLEADRRGTGFAIQNRKKMLAAIKDYQDRLQQANRIEWDDLPHWIMEFIQAGRINLWRYDFILVDEGQFFAPLWFEIIRKNLRQPGGQIFIAADPRQGFFGRGATWRSMGFEVRGHSHFLSTCYRTTREILNFAMSFFVSRVSEGQIDEDMVEPNMFGMRQGIKPALLQIDQPQAEVQRVVAEICDLHKLGVPLGDFLVLTHTWKDVEDIILLLQTSLDPTAAADAKKQPPGDYVRVTTLKAGTGIESPVVILVGLYQMFDEEESFRWSEDELHEIIKDNTQRLYMAFTRAGERLIITYVGDVPEALSGLLR